MTNPQEHVKALEYEVALLQAHIDTLRDDQQFSISVNRAVQAYLLDRIHIVKGN